MSLSNPKLCPLCREKLLNQVVVSEASIQQALARFRQQASPPPLTTTQKDEGHSVETKSVSVLVPETHIALIDQAIAATGIEHHGEALLSICKFYLESTQ